MSDKGVCRTAPATTGLLNMYILNSFGSLSKTFPHILGEIFSHSSSDISTVKYNNTQITME